MPAARLRVRALEHLVDRLGVLGTLLAVAPVLVGELPRLARIVAARLEALELLLVGDVHPELEHEHALGGERALELDDLAVRPPPLRFGREALDALDEHAAVPAAVEH